MRKNVISFSLWGSDPSYYVGLRENIRLRDLVYPGWGIRVYTHNLQHDIGDIVTSSHDTEFVDVPVTRGKLDGMFWRFTAIDVPGTEAFISRDLDSRLNYREKAAVDEWLSSGKSLHVMRDHKNHNTAILGGMWGLKKTPGRPTMSQLINKWGDYRSHRVDQVFLRRVVWPLYRGDCISHDSRAFSAFMPSKPFPAHEPILDGGRFVGQQYNQSNSPVLG